MPTQDELDKIVADARANQTAGAEVLARVADFQKRSTDLSKKEARTVLGEVITVAKWLFIVATPLATLVWGKGAGTLFKALGAIARKIADNMGKKND